MYQCNSEGWNPFAKDRKCSKENFENLVKVFEESYISLEENPKELDLDLQYTITHACIWNNPETIGKVVTILEKNEKLCLVMFGRENNKFNLNILQCLFRVEDLTKLKN